MAGVGSYSSPIPSARDSQNAVPLTLSRQDLTSLHTVQLRMVTDFNFKIAGDRGSEEWDAAHFDGVHQLTSAALPISKSLAD
jgi:hypothetical protein